MTPPGMPARMDEVDVAIVGAGAAGLAAAARLRVAGHSTLLLEAAARVGGRAHTLRPAVLGGAWFDAGASWMHAPERNRLVEMAHARGIPLDDAFGGRERVLFTEAGRASDADEQAYEAAETEWRQRMEAADPGLSLAEAAGAFRTANPWAASVEHWEATLIAAADPDLLGVADWAANQLPDGDLIGRDGLGTLLERCFGEAAGPVRCGAAVEAIDLEAASHVGIETAQGRLRARCAIVTVSTGVLRTARIRFRPALPAPVLDAIARLPMGLLSKVALKLADGDTLDVHSPRGGLIERRLARPGEPAMHFNATAQDGRLAYLIGFVGGRTAWDLATDAGRAEDFARERLASLYGPARIGRALGHGAFASSWGTDPHHFGAYAYAGPGDHGARAALQTPVQDGRLLFAGEASHADGLAGTVGGAIAEGERAAAIATQVLARSARGV